MDKSYILIDNGLLQKICLRVDGDRLFSALYSESTKLGLPDIRKQEAVVTPFSLLEAIGIGCLPSVNNISADRGPIERAKNLAISVVGKKESIRVRRERIEKGRAHPRDANRIEEAQAQIKELEREISNIIDATRTYLLGAYRAFFSAHARLTPVALQMLYDAQYAVLSDTGKEAYDRFFRNHINAQSDVDYISQYLAADATYKFDWPKEVWVYRDVHIIADMLRSLKDDNGVMQTRGLKYLWINFSEFIIAHKNRHNFGMSDAELKAQISDTTEAFDLKTREDLLDTEMLQFLITGKLFQGKFTPVFVYTLESKEKFMKRITLLKSLITSCREAFKPKDFDLPEFSPGTIVFVDHDGHISETVSIDSVDPFLKDR